MEVGDANAFERRSEAATEPLGKFTRDRQKAQEFRSLKKYRKWQEPLFTTVPMHSSHGNCGMTKTCHRAAFVDLICLTGSRTAVSTLHGHTCSSDKSGQTSATLHVWHYAELEALMWFETPKCCIWTGGLKSHESLSVDYCTFDTSDVSRWLLRT